MIDPGKMDRLIEFQRDQGEKAGTGQKIHDWQPIDDPAGTWAHVHSPGGDENFDADQKRAVRKRKVAIWYRSDLLETDTVWYEDRRWDIKSIEEIGRREGISISIQWMDGQYS